MMNSSTLACSLLFIFSSFATTIQGYKDPAGFSTFLSSDQYEFSNGAMQVQDLCANNTLNTCDDKANCTVTDDGNDVNCTCFPGYTGNGTNCEDIDECKNPDTCHDNATCGNTDGSFNCTCNEGFTGNGKECQGEDLCANDTLNICDDKANCTVTDDGNDVNCTCFPGYIGNGTNCEDIDECNEDSNSCHDSATCTNTIGSFDCSCNEGFTGIDTECQDINECEVLKPCDSNAKCDNSDGSYTCSCNNGYTGNGISCSKITCENIQCNDPLSWCNDERTPVECSCKPGFYNSGNSTCQSGLFFGGELYVANNTNANEVETFLNEIYCDVEKKFVRVEVTGNTTTDLRAVMTAWSYLIMYESDSSAFEAYVINQFTSFMEEESQSCDKTENCLVQAGGVTFSVDYEQSANSVGYAEEVVCTEIGEYCDENSAVCKNNDGIPSCQCKPEFVSVFGNDRSCAEKLCNSSSECNSPFGECDSTANAGVGVCKCMFGFEGQKCKSPWLFVFIIVGGFLTLLSIVLLGCLCFSMTKKQKTVSDARDLVEQNQYVLEQNPKEEKNGSSTVDYSMTKMRATIPKGIQNLAVYKDDESMFETSNLSRHY